MRLPVATRIVITVIAIAVLFILGILFMTTLGGARSDVSSAAEATESKCQTDCQNLIAIGFNYDSCEGLMSNELVQEYVSECVEVYGSCTVTIKKSISCIVR